MTQKTHKPLNNRMVAGQIIADAAHSAIVMNAHKLAHVYHAYQTYNNEPYVMHCAEVVETAMWMLEAEIAENTSGYLVAHQTEKQQTDDVASILAAAWLHDTVEDSDLSILKISKETNPLTAEMVWLLTDIFGAEDGHDYFSRLRAGIFERGKPFHMLKALNGARLIKLADRYTNIKNLEVCAEPRRTKLATRYVRQEVDFWESCGSAGMRGVRQKMTDRLKAITTSIIKNY